MLNRISFGMRPFILAVKKCTLSNEVPRIISFTAESALRSTFLKIKFLITIVWESDWIFQIYTNRQQKNKTIFVLFSSILA